MEKGKVDIKFDDVADILPGKENVCIKVRVLRLWKVTAFLNSCESSSVEIVLVDEKLVATSLIGSGNVLNMYLNPRVRGSIPTEGKNSTSEGGREDRE
ncbi:hypothetical protein A2U01_0041775, partial [Trifolium medium]|nr:hypothetical protein [Trifolium medium]